MKRLIIMLVVAGAFLGGYYVGHQPGSPNIFLWVQQTYGQIAEAGSGLGAVVKKEAGKASEGVKAAKHTVCINGRTCVVGADNQEQAAPQPRR